MTNIKTLPVGKHSLKQLENMRRMTIIPRVAVRINYLNPAGEDELRDRTKLIKVQRQSDTVMSPKDIYVGLMM